MMLENLLLQRPRLDIAILVKLLLAHSLPLDHTPQLWTLEKPCPYVRRRDHVTVPQQVMHRDRKAAAKRKFLSTLVQTNFLLKVE
jgi:hypothetical protein